MTSLEWGTPEPVGTSGSDATPPAATSTVLTINPDDLMRVVRAVEHARASDEARPVLTWLHFTPDPAGYVVETADNYRIARALLPAETVNPEPFLLPGDAVKMMLKALGMLSRRLRSAVKVTLTIEPAGLFDTRPWALDIPAIPLTLRGRCATGNYPNTSDIMRRHKTEHTVWLNPRYLAEVAEAARAAGDLHIAVTLAGAEVPVRFRSAQLESVVMPVRNPEGIP